jgi:hypothetical protein
MKFQLNKASDYKMNKKVEINTIEELAALQAQYGGHDLIVSFEDLSSPTITIYDAYVE